MSKVYVYNEKLKHARELRGWSQEELARRVGCIAESMGRQGVVLDVSTVSRWERGRNSPSPFYRQLLCTLFEMNAQELGLLPSDNQPQLVENPFALPTLQAPETTFGDQAEIYGGGMTEGVERNAGRKEIVVSANSSNAPARYILSIRRRDILLGLVTSVAVGGGAAFVVRLFQSHRQPSTPDSPPPDHPPAPTSTSVAQNTPDAQNTPIKQNPPAPTQAPSIPLSRYWPALAPDRVKTVANARVLQWMLNAHGWRLEVDGIFWVDTETALRAFEKSVNIPVTMTLDKLTWERLIIPSGMAGQQVTDQGDNVKALQEMLNNYGTSPRLDVDGSFGPLTRAAISKFQQTHKLPSTGQADINTWCLLVGGYLR